MGNTGYKFFDTLERYYTDDNTSTGDTKPNIKKDADYIAPFLDEIECLPSARFYNTLQSKTVTKNDCQSGYLGNDITLTAYPNQFVSNQSVLDADNQAIAWLDANAQIYANNVGTCTLDMIPPTASILNASSITLNSLKLSWTAATDNLEIVGYEIFQNDTFLASTSADILQYDVTGLLGSTTYNFYVKAKDAAGNSSKSNLVTVTIAPSTLRIPVTKSVIFENRNSNWLTCHDADAATTYYTGNAYLGAANDTSQFILNRYRGAIDTYNISSTPKSAKIRFKFASNNVGNALTFNLFYSNIFSLHAYSQTFELIDWNDWDSNTFIGSVTVASNSTEYVEININPSYFYLLTQREGFNFFLISNGDKEKTNPPSSNNRPILSTTTDTGEIYLECEL
ncbi:DUF5977 domain-containing protein [Flavobacterium branchiicola]|uniref:DUF5977 domain-containing protein n=1 Tax=Flavobacterium branchiicola TaxID=1114875 RepID=A0ABV9PC22_9FLAO|nr:DUF5977 domain-containing protein [Flavobacterium branchiicola]MBS7253500.1 fibronectin type III domain-containing protein [Flavobacterium branchiicola]